MNNMIEKYAHLSKCKKYRYALWRIWDESKPAVMFVCLNPSTADEVEDDPTIRRCIGFARSWGYGALCVANLFAFRSTNPSVIFSEKDPVGQENDNWLLSLAKDSEIVVAAWGNQGAYLGRSKEVLKLLSTVYCLKLNKSGEPAHPLYQPASAQLILLPN